MKDRRTRAELLHALAEAHAAVGREAQRLGAELARLKSEPPRIVEVLPAGWPAFIGEAYAAGYEAYRRRNLLNNDPDK